jgi:hypothetical protein
MAFSVRNRLFEVRQIRSWSVDKINRTMTHPESKWCATRGFAAFAALAGVVETS